MTCVHLPLLDTSTEAVFMGPFHSLLYFKASGLYRYSKALVPQIVNNGKLNYVCVWIRALLQVLLCFDDNF